MKAPASTALARVVARLRETGMQPYQKKGQQRWLSRCPRHPEAGVHLVVTPGADDRAALACKAECSLADIVRSAGLAPEDVEQGPFEPMDRPAEFSDDALALEFTALYRDEYRYTAAWGKWHRWEASVWREDSTLAVFDRVRTIVRRIAAGAEKQSVKSSITSAGTVSAVEKLARSDRNHAASIDQWDAGQWLLNTPGGVVDLCTGAIRPARPKDYMTRQTAAALSADVPVRWMKFLCEITGGDEELQGFLRRLAGYCLTGSTKAHAMFFLYGRGGNGKGTFLNTLTRLLHDYAKVAPIDTFTASKWDRHPTELAMLQGARLVSSQETEEGRRWAEAKIKALTGGDPISARFMKKDHFQYDPQFKLVIAGNHQPQLQNVDEAMRRRFHLVPFEQTIAAKDRIEGLDEMLRPEFGGILGWALDGCLEWQRDGLRPPEVVRDATNNYFEAEDSFQAWLDECCEQRPGHRATSAELYQSWREWAEHAGESPGSSKVFAGKLQSKNFAPCVIGHAKTRGYVGLELLDINTMPRRDRADVA